MSMASFETILLTVIDGIATITLNRPEQMNSCTPAMVDELVSAFDLTDADDAVRAVIVTGSGDRAFCAGADISAGPAAFGDAFAPSGEPGRAEEVVRDGGGLVSLRIFASLKPVIGAINGVAAGFGATMPLAMDVRIASVDARFGFVFSRRGLAPEAASSWFLPRIVGISTALEWCYGGGIVSAGSALDRGLVRSLHASEDLMPAAFELARSFIDSSAPVSIALIRQMMWRMLGADHPMEAHRIDSRAIQHLGPTDDAREGVGAFLEKRPSHFSGRVSRDMPAFYPWWNEPEFR